MKKTVLILVIILVALGGLAGCQKEDPEQVTVVKDFLSAYQDGAGGEMRNQQCGEESGTGPIAAKPIYVPVASKDTEATLVFNAYVTPDDMPELEYDDSKVNDNEYEVTVTGEFSQFAAMSEDLAITFVVKKDGDEWCIDEIKIDPPRQ
ncbi:MAG: hypothetical protein GYB65_07080 [Chloroflexi bacterium]|nr:hypothetical protein [Chloroflexota bacterium]